MDIHLWSVLPEEITEQSAVFILKTIPFIQEKIHISQKQKQPTYNIIEKNPIPLQNSMNFIVFVRGSLDGNAV